MIMKGAVLNSSPVTEISFIELVKVMISVPSISYTAFISAVASGETATEAAASAVPLFRFTAALSVPFAEAV